MLGSYLKDATKSPPESPSTQCQQPSSQSAEPPCQLLRRPPTRPLASDCRAAAARPRRLRNVCSEATWILFLGQLVRLISRSARSKGFGCLRHTFARRCQIVRTSSLSPRCHRLGQRREAAPLARREVL